MVLVAGHDKERNINAGLFDDIHHVLNEALHNIDGLGNADIVHALGIIGTKSCSHAACKKNRTDLLSTECLKTYFLKVLSVLLDLRDLHRPERTDLSSHLVAVRILRIADHREIGLVDLLKKGFLLLIGELIIIIKHVLLPVFFQFFLRILEIHCRPP